MGDAVDAALEAANAGYQVVLVEKRPYSLDFQQYVAIITRTKGELAYDTLSDISRSLVDEVYGLRDECVARP